MRGRTRCDATASFDGERIRLDRNWKTEESKTSGGPRTILLPDLELVEWVPAAGLENGYLRFVVAKATATAAPKYDPHAVVLYGFTKDPLMPLVAAAVVARMPHPGAPAKSLAVQPPAPERPADAPPTVGDEGDVDHDALLRRLRELGDLHQSGIPTEAEFTTAKQAVLRRFPAPETRLSRHRDPAFPSPRPVPARYRAGMLRNTSPHRSINGCSTAVCPTMT